MQRRHSIACTRSAIVMVLVMVAVAIPTMRLAAQESDRDAFRKLHHELRQQMDEDLQAATKFLDNKIAADPESADLNVLRHSLASRFAKERKYAEANKQFGKLLNFQINHIDQSENVYGVWMTIQSLQEIAEESRNDDAFKAAVQRGYDALSGLPAEQAVQAQLPRSQLAVLKAQLMVDDHQIDLAKELIEQHLTELIQANDSDQATETAMGSLVHFLRSVTSPARGNDEWRDDYIRQLDEVISQAIEKYPTSQRLQIDYADVQLLMVTRWAQDDPNANEERIESVSEKLALIATKNDSVLATLRRIELHKARMASVKPVSSLVGKPAPDWEIDAWVNTFGVTQESFKGKVVLVDFWAMWCGPCVATFPHLREWREEFGDDGFEIVGVTKYYNFEWDDENRRASPASGKVTPAEERETLAKFLEHHKLQHPVFVSTEDSQMSSDYGVRGIPHVALIDQDGVVQLVKTGAGESTAKEIHARIKELVAARAEE